MLRGRGVRTELAIVGACLGFMIAVAAAPRAQAAEPGFGRTISVSGTCLRSAIPDRGSIVITPEFTDPDIKSAAKKATGQYEAIKAEIQKLNLKNLELSTNEYSVLELREWEKNKQVSKGFRARMGLQVTTSETSRLGEVIAIAAARNVKDVGALQTFLSDEKSRGEREACLEEAIQHAQTKAGRMAKAAGARLGRVLQLNEEGASSPPPMPMVPMMAMKASGGMEREMQAPSVDSAAQKIQLSVSALYQLE